MDATTRRLVDCALGPRYSALPSTVVHECKRRLIDTFACVVGCYHEPLSIMSRKVAERYAGVPEAHVWGCTWKTSVEAAAFANGVMLRLLDMNDMFRVKSGGHPSDVISGVWAVGEHVGAGGQDLIGAVTLAYDVYCSFCEAVDINTPGWDQPVYGALACALGAGRLLKLSPEQLANAVSLALVSNMALHRTRRGELSSWKGCAGANGSRNGVFAALLARDGFSGPTEIFEGKGGLWDIVGRFDWRMVTAAGEGPYRVTQTHMKCFPICYHGQPAAWLALDIRPKLRVEDIQDIRVETYEEAVRFTASEPSCWAPRTSASADHSLPYVVAVALLDGRITVQSFAEQRLDDPVIGGLMRKVKVVESKEMSDRYPEAAPCRLIVRLKDGKELVEEVQYPKGQAKNPMTDAELERKFQDAFQGLGDDGQCRKMLDALWSLEQEGAIAGISTHFSG